MKPFAVMTGLIAATLLVACSGIKDDAIEAGVEIDKLCKEKKNDDANTIGVTIYEKNAVFKEAVNHSAGVWKIKEVANYNYCGPAFDTGRRRMAEAREPEGCGCQVVGADGRRGAAVWLAVGVGVALWRRRRGLHC